MKAEFPFVFTEGQKDIREGRNTLSQNHGWFFIHFLVSVKNGEGQKIFNSYKEQFDSTNNVQPNWYCSHFTSDELSSILDYKSIEIFEHKKPVTKRAAETPKKFIVKACNNWVPSSTNVLTNHLGFGIYVVEGASYNVLDNDADVLIYEPYEEMKFRNRFTAGFLQSGESVLKSENSHYWVSRSLQMRGIDGKGQVVVIGDSGVDTNHSFFYDKDHKIENGVTNLEHRKVVRYEAIIDGKDSLLGHGTHVAGTLLGKCWDNQSVASLYDGVAPEAKLWFIDIAADDDSVYNFDVEKNITKAMKETDAGIFSGSFGSPIHNPLESIVFDTFSWLKKEFLFIFAAGNDGYVNGNKVGTPADSVNSLTVANSLQSPAQQMLSPERSIFKLTDNNNRLNSILIKPEADHFPELVNKDNHLLDISKLKISTEIIEDGIYLVPKEANFEEKAVEGVLGGIAFIVFEEGCVIPQDLDIRSSPFGFCSCSSQKFAVLKTFTSVSLDITPMEEYPITPSSSSSMGPAATGLLKPDIAAPGSDIISARSMGEKSVPTNDTSERTLKIMSGTSMATPAISGAATLFRQYFMDGWYPTGKPTEENKMKPYASLLKAALINSATAERDDVLGFGLPKLELGMGFKPGTGVMFVNNKDIGPREEQAYRITTTEDGELSITLSFTAPPRNPYGYKPLDVEMHMRIEDENGKVITPPQEQSSLSTNSKILFNAKKGEYHLFITSTDYISTVSMSYSLAVRGKFQTAKLNSETNIIPTNCTVGRPRNGKCSCPSTATGAYCQIPIIDTAMNGVYYLASRKAPTWFKPGVIKNQENVLFVFPQSYNSNMRICITTDKDIDVNSNMNCYLFTPNDNKQKFKVGNDPVYFIVYPTNDNSYFQVLPSAAVPTEEGQQDAEYAGDLTADQETTILGLLIGFVLIAIVLAIALAIYCLKSKPESEAVTGVSTPILV